MCANFTTQKGPKPEKKGRILLALGERVTLSDKMCKIDACYLDFL